MFVTLAVEDRLSETVARRLIADYAPGLQVFETMGLKGNNYLRQNLRQLNQIASNLRPALVFTDLDRSLSCPPALIHNWTEGIRQSPDLRSPDLLIRVAVLEIEAWLLADRHNAADWLSVAISRIPANPESIPNPKRLLIELAGRSRKRELRTALVPRRGIGTDQIGPDYNQAVGDFAVNHWNPEIARQYATSLNRAIIRIAELAARQPA